MLHNHNEEEVAELQCVAHSASPCIVTIWNISLSKSPQDDQDHDHGDGGRHMEDILVGVQEYGPGVWLGRWNRTIVSINVQLP